MLIVQTPVLALRPYARNARTHSRQQIRQIAKSIEKFGFLAPVLVDDQNQILAGHGRVEAAKLLGMATVPTVQFSHLNEADKRAFILADNRLAELAGWDRELLVVELQGLIDLGFEVELTGFETPEIDLLIEEVSESKADPGPEDDIPELSAGPPVTRPKDLWILGAHRLLCGDAREDASYVQLLGAARADVVFTDPPYNVPVRGHVSGRGRVQHREFAMAAGEMTEVEFTAFLKRTLGHATSFSRDGAVHFICCDWRHVGEFLAAGRELYGELLNICIWAKTNFGLGALYRSQHEFVLVYRVGTAAHLNNVEHRPQGRNRSNLWRYAGVNTFRAGRLEELAMHPTVKPVALIADAIRDVSRRNDIVLDPFCGSGSTIVAAEKTGRHAYALEIDPAYVDASVRRWEKFTGKVAIHTETGMSFEETAEARLTKVDASAISEMPKIPSPLVEESRP